MKSHFRKFGFFWSFFTFIIACSTATLPKYEVDQKSKKREGATANEAEAIATSNEAAFEEEGDNLEWVHFNEKDWLFGDSFTEKNNREKENLLSESLASSKHALCQAMTEVRILNGVITRNLSYDGMKAGVPVSVVLEFARLIDYRSIFKINSLQRGDQFWFEVDQNDSLKSAMLMRPNLEKGVLALISDDRSALFEIQKNKISPLRNAIVSPIEGDVSEVITQTYGLQKDGDFHDAVDIDLEIGEPVFSILPGTVKEVGYKKEHAGYYIKIEHAETVSPLLPKSFISFYAHLNKGSIRVKEGDRVYSGQIAEGGNSGNVNPGKGSDGSHLHLAAFDPSKNMKPFDLTPHLVAKVLPEPEPGHVAQAQATRDCLRAGSSLGTVVSIN